MHAQPISYVLGCLILYPVAQPTVKQVLHQYRDIIENYISGHDKIYD